ncbi:MAG: hypothetical protein ABW047_06890 [Nitrospiraceae bacterium]
MKGTYDRDPRQSMKPVVQEDLTGCGLAGVAMLAGVTYRQVRSVARRMGISAADPRLWSSTSHVRRLLAWYGVRAAAKELPFVSWERLPPVALLAIKWCRKGGREYWHWVVFHRGPQGPVVLDPKQALRTHERRDFGRMKPKWFITVT